MTCETQLSFSEAAKLVGYDPMTGSFWRVTKTSNSKPVGVIYDHNPSKHGYKLISVKNKKYAQHRLAWLLTYKQWPKGHVDHINGDKLDNRISNLRDVPPQINCLNRKTRIPSYHKGSKLWRVRLTVAGKEITNYFKSKHEAEKACYFLAETIRNSDEALV